MTTVNLTAKFLSNARGLSIADSASAVWSFNPNTNTLTLAAGGGATGFANPSAKVGLTAVNGMATTAMRSDGAPPIDQSIAPTWTGNHAFTPGSGIGLTVNGLNNAAIATFASQGASGGYIRFYDNTNSLVRGYFGYGPSLGNLVGDLTLSAAGTGNIYVTRAGDGANAVQFGPNGNFSVLAPSSGDAATITNVAGANALTVNGNAAGTAVVRLNTQATTGVQTATFAATNKPGSGTTGPDKWLPVSLDGTTHYIPCFL